MHITTSWKSTILTKFLEIKYIYFFVKSKQFSVNDELEHDHRWVSSTTTSQNEALKNCLVMLLHLYCQKQKDLLIIACSQCGQRKLTFWSDSNINWT